MPSIYRAMDLNYSPEEKPCEVYIQFTNKTFYPIGR